MYTACLYTVHVRKYESPFKNVVRSVYVYIDVCVCVWGHVRVARDFLLLYNSINRVYICILATMGLVCVCVIITPP